MGVRFDQNQLSLVTENNAPPALVEYIFGVIRAAVSITQIEPTEANLYTIASVIANTLSDLVDSGRIYRLPLGGWGFEVSPAARASDPCDEDVYLEEFRGMRDKTFVN